MRTLLLFLVVATIAGLAVYWARNDSSADPVVPADPQPQVAGRLVSLSVGDSAEGSSYLEICEYDARVDTEGKTVTRIAKQGRGPEIKAGDLVVDIQYEPSRPGSGPGLEEGPLGQKWYDLPVYYLGSQLHVGCAPESVTIKTH